jgi:hypothetical protein
MLLCKGNVEGNFIVVWAGSVDSSVEDVDFDNVYLSFAESCSSSCIWAG